MHANHTLIYRMRRHTLPLRLYTHCLACVLRRQVLFIYFDTKLQIHPDSPITVLQSVPNLVENPVENEGPGRLAEVAGCSSAEATEMLASAAETGAAGTSTSWGRGTAASALKPCMLTAIGADSDLGSVS